MASQGDIIQIEEGLAKRAGGGSGKGPQREGPAQAKGLWLGAPNLLEELRKDQQLGGGGD